MNALAFGLAAATSLATGALITKNVVDRLPPRQLIGPLFLLNALMLWPLAPWATWVWSPGIVVLHAVTVVVMAATALAVFELFAHGAASAVTTAQATSPLPAALAVALLIPGTFAWIHVLAAVLVVGGVLWALADAFGDLGRGRSVTAIAVAATGGALITVLSRLLTDHGAGVVEIYTVRTTLAGVIFVLAIPPRDIPLGALPVMAVRAAFVSLGFACTILGVQRGSPTVVQTMIALTPMLVLAWEIVATRTRPPRRAIASVLLVLAGVVVLLAT